MPVISPKVTTLTRTTVLKEHEAKVTGEQLVSLINFQRRQLGQSTIPDQAAVYFTVPSGGDYSGADLDLDEHSVTIKWTEKTEQVSEDITKPPPPPAPPIVPVDGIGPIKKWGAALD